MNQSINCSIVCYNNNRDILASAINSFLSSKLKVKLFLIDNSPDDSLRNLCADSRVEYLFNPSNPGFGAAHNIAINQSIKLDVKYHFIINPDIYFHDDVITPMINYMEKHTDVGMMMPEILYPDGRIQHLPKLLPNPFWVFRRKFKKPANSYNAFINQYELRQMPKKTIFNSPILSGCFTLLNLKAIKEVGGYDEQFFMYFEDFDLSRRVHSKYKTIYFPEVSVYHGYESGASKNLKLFKIFLSSAISYFNKWGWIIDKERTFINTQALSQFQKK